LCKNSKPRTPVTLAISPTPNHQTVGLDELPVISAGEIGSKKAITTVEKIAITVPIRTGKIALESDAAMWKE
jgi:hypothetical protein